MEYSVCDDQYGRRWCSSPRVELAQTIVSNSARYLYLAACRSVAMCLSISIGNSDDGLVIEQDSMLISTGGSFSFPVGVCKGDAFVTPVLAGARARVEHRRLHDLVHWRMWDSIDYCEYPPPARWGWNISDTRTIPEGSARLIGLSGQLDSPGLASLAALAALVSLGFWLRRRPRGAGSPVVQISS